MKYWSDQEVQFLYDHADDMTVKEVAQALGRSLSSVDVKRARLGIKKSKSWTEEDDEYLEEYYGIRSVDSIARKLGRTRKAVIRRANTTGISFEGNAMGMSAIEVSRLIGVPPSTLRYWCKNCGLRSKKVGGFRFVTENDLCRWLEIHPERWDATKCDKTFFGRYEWFWKKRDYDFQKMIKKRWGSDAV